MPIDFEEDFDQEMVLSEVFPGNITIPSIDNQIVEPGDDDEEEDAPWATHWLFDEPGMDDIMYLSGGSLQEMFDRLKVQPMRVPKDDGSDEEKVLVARYEMPQWNKDFTHPEAVIGKVDGARAWADFMQGVPYDTGELMGLVYEDSTKVEDVDVIEAQDDAASPVPEDLFEGFLQEDKLFELMGVESNEDTTDPFADDLQGEDVPENPHFWMRNNLFDTSLEDNVTPTKKPIPGEFVGMGLRMYPTQPWGEQKSTPFIISGNWFETVFYSSGKVQEVYPPDESHSYPRYRVNFRNPIPEGQETAAPIIAKPSDFASYNVGDRVAVLKEVKDAKDTMTWKDIKNFDTEAWSIAPITFYETPPKEG